METVEVTAPEEITKPDGAVVETGSEGSAPSIPKAGTSEDTSDWTEKAQKRYHELTRERYEALRERDIERYEREQLQQRLEQFEKAKTEPVAPEQFPTLEQFGFDEGKYAAAVAQHYSKLATEQGTKAAQEALRAERERQEAETAHKTWSQRQADFKKSKPDYDAVALKDPREGGPTITPSMAQIIRASDVGPQVAYYLGENVDKANAIAQLHPIDQAREIGRIEAKLELAKAPPKPAVSQAPPPVQKVDVSDAPVDSDPSVMTDKQFAKWREKQIAARRNQ